MPVPTDITAGTLTITNGSTAVTGAGTSWLASDLRQGDLILWIEGGDGFWQPILQSVDSNTALTLAEPWEGPTLAAARYRIRYQWDSSRVSAQSRQLIELLDNGNLLAFSALTGPGVPVFNGPHSIVIKPETDFINGVSFDVQVDTLPDRAAYDGQSAGFTVLVADVGDGRSAVYSKNSNASADWSDPAYITGPVGPMPNIEAGTIATGLPGTSYIVTIDPITGGYEINFTIPAPPGFYWENVYNPANTYPLSSVVRYNGSSFIAVQAVPLATPPSGAFPPVDTAYWEVLASKGADGTGTGDVVGPSGAVNSRMVEFDGTTGKLIKDGGVAVSAFMKTVFDDADAPTARTTLGAIGGNAGSTDNRLLRADGAGGATLQGSAVTLDDSGNLTGIAALTSSGLMTLNGGQIAFPATQIPSSDANTLDDYEEGTYTPTYANIAVGNGVVNTRYTKVGRFVSVKYQITFGTTSSLNASAITIGLPFTGVTMQVVGPTLASDVGTAFRYGCAFSSNGTAVTFTHDGSPANWTSSIPFSWTTNDVLTFSYEYNTAT